MDLVTFSTLSVLPFFESRYTLPLAIADGWNPFVAWALGTILSIITTTMLCIGLNYVDGAMQKIPWISSFWTNYVSRTRRKLAEKLAVWGDVGLVLFVAIPLPGTGVYSGSVAAYAIGLPIKSSIILISIGAAIANAITVLSVVGILNLF